MHDEANVSYYNWASGEPNNYGGDERCVTADTFSQLAWNDLLCTKTSFIVCELPN
ncbi:hypothetical protein DPMN_061225 [Dreissena polymorpha]|uniref:C-type lectin domain-containing protein n=1 Tax=Dreissena polymorpha TaxID=45954 RepID=A0A9D4C6L6_DREPO|nr:hypothetical protein DPMN_061225 [Dreissena polymorpha]